VQPAGVVGTIEPLLPAVPGNPDWRGLFLASDLCDRRHVLPPVREGLFNGLPPAELYACREVLESRFVIGQMLAAAGYPDEAQSELQAIRPLLAETFGAASAQVRNPDKQLGRLP
jgi:hypothetical protein